MNQLYEASAIDLESIGIDEFASQETNSYNQNRLGQIAHWLGRGVARNIGLGAVTVATGIAGVVGLERITTGRASADDAACNSTAQVDPTKPHNECFHYDQLNNQYIKSCQDSEVDPKTSNGLIAWRNYRLSRNGRKITVTEGIRREDSWDEMGFQWACAAITKGTVKVKLVEKIGAGKHAHNKTIGSATLTGDNYKFYNGRKFEVKARKHTFKLPHRITSTEKKHHVYRIIDVAYSKRIVPNRPYHDPDSHEFDILKTPKVRHSKKPHTLLVK